MKNACRQVMAELSAPTPDQHRVATKIKQLMALCNTLAQKIDAVAAKHSDLLTTLLNTQSQRHADIIDLSTYRSAIDFWHLTP